MDDDFFLVRFWGVRGSIAVSGPEFARYGGNTICIEMRCGKHTLLFDAGSG
ncbi:MAG: MBL fold metallo-hydrolase, partial [Mesorhizobium sp.]